MEGGNGIGDAFCQVICKESKRNSVIVMVISMIIKTIVVMLAYNKI